MRVAAGGRLERGDRQGASRSELDRRDAAQGPPLWRQFAIGGVAVALALALLGAFGVLGAVKDVPYRNFTKEIAEQFVVAPYIGFLAHVTWFLWVVAGTAGLLAAAVLWSLDRHDRRIPFFLGTSLLTAVLLLDDLAMLHEQRPPRVGIREEGLYAFYAVVLVVLLLRFRRQFAAGGALLAVAAGAFWAVSIGADFVQEMWNYHAHAFEDGAKLIGTALWVAFMVWSSLAATGSVTCAATGERPPRS